MSHVFVSSSSNDKITAQAVCEALEKEGVKCWIAPRNILAGMEWGEAIVKAIRNSQAMVLIFSASSNDSPHVKSEVERAVHWRVPIVVFRIEDIEPYGSLELWLSGHHWKDAIPPPPEAYLPILAADLKAFLEQREQHIPSTTQSFRSEAEKETDILEIEPSVEADSEKEADILEIEPSVEAEPEKETDASLIIESAKEETEDEVVEAPLIIESAKDEPQEESEVPLFVESFKEGPDEVAEAPLIIESAEEKQEEPEAPLITESSDEEPEEEAKAPLIIESSKEEPKKDADISQIARKHQLSSGKTDSESPTKNPLSSESKTAIVAGLIGLGILIIIIIAVATQNPESPINSNQKSNSSTHASNASTNTNTEYPVKIVDVNFTPDAKKTGMTISAKLKTSGFKGKTLSVVVYFYWYDGLPLKSLDDNYKTSDNSVAAGKDITLNSSPSDVKVDIFMPYDELEMVKGSHSLRFNIVVWDESKIVGESDHVSFPYNQK